MDKEKLVKVVKENLPSNVSLTREPYNVTLADNLPYIHGYMGYVFHTKTVFSDGRVHEEMLFVSNIPHANFHNAISIFNKSIKELSDRCYWIERRSLNYESSRICTKYN